MATVLPIEKQFAVSALRRAGLPVTPTSVKNLIGWARAEGGHTHNNARFNFLNTTQPMPGAGNTGSQGNIKVYRSLGQGVDATVKTLKNGRYGAILSSVNADPSTFARAVNSTPWGTKSDFSSISRSLDVGNVTNTPGAGGAVPPAASPAPGATIGQRSIDGPALMRLLNEQRQRVLAGQMPTAGYQQQLSKLARQAYPRAQTTATAQGVGAQVVNAAASVGNAVGSPIAGQAPHSASHQTSGLPGYPAFDYMAPAGTRVGAPVSGTVIKLSGKDPKLGGAPGGPLGYSVYIKGTDGRTYFLTHIDKVGVKVGQKVRQGQQIAVIANGPKSWSSPHVHMGIHG